MKNEDGSTYYFLFPDEVFICYYFNKPKDLYFFQTKKLGWQHFKSQFYFDYLINKANYKYYIKFTSKTYLENLNFKI